MRGGNIDVSFSKEVPMTEAEALPYLVKKGDVFVVRGNGSKHLCGLAGYIRANVEGVIFPDLFIRVDLPTERVLPEFFVATWNSSATRAAIEEKAKTTSGIWKVNQGHILSTQVPVPDIEEQRQIVTELGELHSQVDLLKAMQRQTAGELDALLPSVLNSAFDGDL